MISFNCTTNSFLEFNSLTGGFNMFRNLSLFLLFFLQLVCVHGYSPKSPAVYLAPNDVEIALAPDLNAEKKENEFQLQGKVSACFGNLTSLTIRFTSSSDLLLETMDKAPAELASGAEILFKVIVKPNSKPHDGKSWVKMHFEYMSDYQAQENFVKEQTETYSDPFLKTELLSKLENRRKESTKACLVSGHYFLEAPFKVK
ncbi:MAG: hypothetical protein HQM10_21660 [Candidatus Riflebacteria bacterium]|nr:hypothetical protein [Candidatus Riflebacteria bacterium]